MEYIENWKKEEIESIVNGYDNFIEDKEIFFAEALEAQEKLLRLYDSTNDKPFRDNFGNDTNKIVADKILLRYTKDYYIYKDSYESAFRYFDEYKELYIDYRQKCNSYYGFMSINSIYTECKKDMTKLRELATKAVEKQYKKLQAKVEAKIGKIIKRAHICGDNYNFIGELDKCNVRVITAGGYNIQKLHTRWIITKNI